MIVPYQLYGTTDMKHPVNVFVIRVDGVVVHATTTINPKDHIIALNFPGVTEEDIRLSLTKQVKILGTQYSDRVVAGFNKHPDKLYEWQGTLASWTDVGPYKGGVEEVMLDIPDAPSVEIEVAKAA